jgi:hypothetical protein
MDALELIMARADKAWAASSVRLEEKKFSAAFVQSMVAEAYVQAVADIGGQYYYTWADTDNC